MLASSTRQNRPAFYSLGSWFTSRGVSAAALLWERRIARLMESHPWGGGRGAAVQPGVEVVSSASGSWPRHLLGKPEHGTWTVCALHVTRGWQCLPVSAVRSKQEKHGQCWDHTKPIAKFSGRVALLVVFLLPFQSRHHAWHRQRCNV